MEGEEKGSLLAMRNLCHVSSAEAESEAASELFSIYFQMFQICVRLLYRKDISEKRMKAQ